MQSEIDCCAVVANPLGQPGPAGERKASVAGRIGDRGDTAGVEPLLHPRRNGNERIEGITASQGVVL